MISQDIRKIAPEMDPLRRGMGWSVEDLSKPQIIVESTFGDSHPGSAHLMKFANNAVQGVAERGGKAARYLQQIYVMVWLKVTMESIIH